MTAVAQALSAALLHFIWQGTLVACLLWVTISMLRTRSANARYIASCLALALMAALPAVTAWMLYAHAASLPVSSTISTGTAAGVYASRVAREAQPLTWIEFWRQWTLPVGSLGVFVFALRLGLGCRHVAALRRLGHAADGQLAATVSLLARRMKTTRAIRILISAVAESPSVVGWLRPVILLPAATLAGLDPEQLQAVLAHEIAHIRRHDYLINLAQTLVETLLFHPPAVWWASARIRHERELCCDDAAVAACGNAIVYARALTSLERLRAATPRLAMASTGGSLQHRIERLAGVRPERQASKLPGLAALALGLACLAMTVHLAKAQSGQMKEQPKVRDEWGVTVSTAGHLLQRGRVAYPEPAYNDGIQGPVTVEATVDREGGVADARVLSGPPELRKAALESVLQWRFANASAGEAQQVRITFQHAEAQAQHTLLAQILATEREMEASKQALNEQTGTQRQAFETQLADLGRQMAEYRKRFLEGDPQARESYQENQSPRDAQMLLFRLEVEREETENLVCVGSRLTRIEIVGFPESEKPDLAAKLPVRIGETLSAASIERAVAKMNGLEPNIVFRLRRLNDSDAVLRIAPFGTELEQLK
jgi:TonB family protein